MSNNEENENTTTNNNNNCPRDKPATTFIPDPYLQTLYTQEQFGVVLVAAWPPSQSFIEKYEKFVSRVKQCFGPIDIHLEQLNTPADNDDVPISIPNAYIYPPQYMHITVATFHPMNQSFFTNENDTDNNDDENMKKKRMESYKQACTKIVQNAMQRNDWPKEKFHLQIDRAQIGEKAGILLWKHVDGGEGRGQGILHRMRNILQVEYEKFVLRDSSIQSRSSSSSTSIEIPKGKEIIIPGIIHSTFLRFSSIPVIPGEIVQDKFQSTVQPYVKEMFGDVCVDSVRLVVEKKA
mmetsp:Transcript_25459/g.31367  ORF Transcript_25459/g.31367 Transcript_25459/m.31367 type:complete len:293 (-) Transcript_25459:107-985(-)